MKEPEFDAINPRHYRIGKIETVEYIEDKKLNYNRGNAIKYITRAGLKNPDTCVEDLEKAVWYIKREISSLKREIDSLSIETATTYGAKSDQGVEYSKRVCLYCGEELEYWSYLWENNPICDPCGEEKRIKHWGEK